MHVVATYRGSYEHTYEQQTRVLYTFGISKVTILTELNSLSEDFAFLPYREHKTNDGDQHLHSFEYTEASEMRK